MRESRAVQGNAHAGRKNRVHETPGIADHQEAVAAKLLHRVAIVAFIFERTNAVRFAQSLLDHGTRTHRAPEKFLAIFFGLGEILLLGYDANAGYIVRDWNLPDPCVRNRQEVNVDIVEVGIALGEYFSVVTIEPGMDSVLVKHLILDLQLHLIAEESVAPARVHHHFRADVHFFRPHVEPNQGFLGTEIHGADFNAVIHGRAQLVGMLQQHKIELAAIDVIRVILVHASLLPLVETNVDIAIRSQAFKIVNIWSFLIVGCPHGSILMRKLCFFHLRKKIQVPEDPGGRRNERFAHVGPRK